MTNQPLVSVIMPVYNGEKYVKESIESILHQTYKNLELIVINDASTDGSAKVITDLTDKRIKFYENETNLGIVDTRNKGIDLASGKYVAIMDNDDISLPHRLEMQVAFLESNPDYSLCGTYYDVIDSNGNFRVSIEVPSSFHEINTFLIFNNCFCHSSVTVRKDLLAENKYSKNYEIMEDYDLVYRLAAMSKLANLPVYLTKYRVHGKNQSLLKIDLMLSQRKKMDARILSDLQIPFTEKEMDLHSNFVNSNYSYFKSDAEIDSLENWLIKIYSAIEKKKEFDAEVIARVIIKRWILLFYTTKNISFRIFYSGMFRKFKFTYLKYLLEFTTDRFRKRFKVS